MINHGRTRSTIKPNEIAIDDYSVWVSSDITPISEESVDGNGGFEGYEYTLEQYDKNEFILLQARKNTSLEQQLTDTQIALCDVYEMLN